MKLGQTHKCRRNLQVDSRAQTLSNSVREEAPLLVHLHARTMLVVFPRAPSTPSSRRARDGADPQARLLQSSWPASKDPGATCWATTTQPAIGQDCDV